MLRVSVSSVGPLSLGLREGLILFWREPTYYRGSVNDTTLAARRYVPLPILHPPTPVQIRYKQHKKLTPQLTLNFLTLLRGLSKVLDVVLNLSQGFMNFPEISPIHNPYLILGSD